MIKPSYSLTISKGLFLSACFFFGSILAWVHAETKSSVENVGIIEKLGQIIPLDSIVTDSTGLPFKIAEFIDRPTIVSFVYYRCPGICSPLLQGLTEVIERMDIAPGIEYKVLTISIDHNETPSVAAKKKENYLKTMKSKIDPEAWRWTVTDEETVKALTGAFGFGFKRAEDGNFIHSGSIMAVSPKGKIARYLYGTEYLPFDLKMALTEAEAEKTGPTVAKLLKYCFSYDPAGRKYVFNILNVVGVLLLLWVAGMFVFFAFFGKKPSGDRFQRGADKGFE